MDRKPARCFKCNAVTDSMFELCGRCGQERYWEESSRLRPSAPRKDGS